ncbi:MAG: gamma-glutamyltransferase family protein [Thaumarchaeota archaeon]|nr:gamma-glutamyltransferase family protein [Nitrososphaerota archaeon]
MSSRSTVMVKNAIVSSSHELASFWGANTLQRGGNVVDAALATSAVLTVVQNNMCGLGGDLFALMKINGKITEINGSGRAASASTIESFTKKGLKQIPSRGPLAAITVPGIVHAWGELSKYATMELKDLLAPAVKYAETGFPITEKYAGSIRASQNSLGNFGEWRRIFIPGGLFPSRGDLFIQKDLANSLRAIIERGPEDFYKGELSERLVEGIADQGGILNSDDFADHESTWNTNPISTEYRGVKIFETSPNSQGATILLWLNMLESFDLVAFDSEKVSKLLIDTCLRAYAERARSIADPKFFPLPRDFTSKSFAQEVLNSERLDIHLKDAEPPDGDTTYFAVADQEGNCMSVIQSNYMGFGSGLVPKGTGTVIHNRGCYFSLDHSHHNSLSPGKRTFHTLCASLGEKDGETNFAVGTMGGDVQPQINVQLMTQLIDFNKDLQRAIDQPRWIIPMTIYERPTTIYCEFEPYDALTLSGRLRVERLGGLSSMAGHAQAVYRTQDGLFGAADPRGDGASVGF